MDAAPVLARIARALRESRLEAILLGMAAAALHGAPVTTVDFDFLFRKTGTNLRKLKRFAQLVGGSAFRPFYPVSSMYRVMNDDAGLQVDFLAEAHGVRSFESLRAKAVTMQLEGETLVVASLEDVVRSKRASGRARDLAAMPVLEATLNETQRARRGR